MVLRKCARKHSSQYWPKVFRAGGKHLNSGDSARPSESVFFRILDARRGQKMEEIGVPVPQGSDILSGQRRTRAFMR